MPRDRILNAIWRKKTQEYCERGHPDAAKLRRLIMERCAKDFWYWATGFAFVHEARILDDNGDIENLDTKVAYIPWPHQIPVIDRILSVLGKRDLRVVKSRAQGASWILVLVFVWCWIFIRGFKGNLVSKDEMAVDRRNDMDSLMGKMDWLIERLPKWMVGTRNKDWRRNYGEHYLTRMDGETAITGYACTGDVASGGRALVFAMDEHAKHPRGPDKEAMASTQPITRCRLFISTPKGKNGAYYEIVHDNTIEEPVLYLSWRDNPTQNRGLYRIVKGKPVAVDEEKYGPLPPEYQDYDRWATLKERLKERGYDLTSTDTRSKWYDEECLRPGANPVLVAQEYDMVFGAEGAQYFAEELINRLKNHVRRPVRGELHVDTEQLTGIWSDNPDGRFKLWCELDIRRHPPMGEYVVACDVSAGVGGSSSSNSAITVFNRRTGVKVGAFASPSVLPYDLAELAVATCRWFVNASGDPAFLIWEANGYGGEFRTRIERSDFRFYFRRKASDGALYSRDTDKAGYWTQKRSKLLGPYREALLEGYFENPELDAVEELREYQMGQDGEPYHVGENDKDDPAGAKGAHGDRCFIAGTMIQTDCGERPIEQLAPGDLVWTRNGLRPVIACGKTGEDQVFSVTLPNDRTLTGTLNHPVWTENRAWVPLLSLTSSDILLVWNKQSRSEEDAWQPIEAECTSANREPRRSCSMAESTIATPTQRERATEDIFGAGESAATAREWPCMSQSGSFITDLFRMATSYITRILIQTTTTSPTSIALPTRSTANSTEPERTSPGIGSRVSIGTSASSAVPSTTHGESDGLGFAARSALRSMCARLGRSFAAESRGMCASGAAGNTSLGGRPKPASVARSAAMRTAPLSVRPEAKRRAVYNLSVADTPEYFAEGVLVHNCIADALAWQASLTFGDQQAARGSAKHLNVNNVRSEIVPANSAAWRRAQYLESMRKTKHKSTW